MGKGETGFSQQDQLWQHQELEGQHDDEGLEAPPPPFAVLSVITDVSDPEIVVKERIEHMKKCDRNILDVASPLGNPENKVPCVFCE